MQGDTILKALSVASAVVLFAACDDRTTLPTAETSISPTALVQPVPEPFTVRYPIDPYFINQAPDFMIRSRARTDLAVQRLVTPPGEGAWHTHPGPSFGLVEQGQVMITRYTKKGCTTEVYGPGETYFEVAGEVHRATVVGEALAVEYKVRFNTPVGEPFAQPANDPGC